MCVLCALCVCELKVAAKVVCVRGNGERERRRKLLLLFTDYEVVCTTASYTLSPSHIQKGRG